MAEPKTRVIPATPSPAEVEELRRCPACARILNHDEDGSEVCHRCGYQRRDE
jgi:hypothetical protein